VVHSVAASAKPFLYDDHASHESRIRALLCDLGKIAIDPPSKKTFDTEGAILEQALKKCLSDREAALKELADAAKRVDKAAFGHHGDFGQAHQALLKALDRAADFIRN
jgi:hypothetical protein